VYHASTVTYPNMAAFRAPAPSDPPVVLCLGRCGGAKGVSVFLRARYPYNQPVCTRLVMSEVPLQLACLVPLCCKQPVMSEVPLQPACLVPLLPACYERGTPVTSLSVYQVYHASTVTYPNMAAFRASAP